MPNITLFVTRESVPSSPTPLIGSLYSWGNGTWGVLGLGDTNDRSSPCQVGNNTDWKIIGAAGRHTFATNNDNELWAWGWNENGALGVGDATHRSSPTQVGTLTDWVGVDGGISPHTVAIKTDGTIWSCGANSYGQLGQGDTNSRSSPTQIGSSTNWASVESGSYSVFAITTNGALFSWGDNGFGQLGHGDTISRSSPTQVGGLTDWEQVFTLTSYHILAIKTNGTLWSWGYNDYGQLGHGNTDNLWSWGYNVNGELGHGNTTHRSSPTQIGSETNWIAVDAGENSSFGIREV